MILAGDIGGTKTVLAVFERNGAGHVAHRREVYTSSQFSSLEQILAAFLETHAGTKIDAACFGVAGPVVDDECRVTNLPWVLRRGELARQLGIEDVWLLNDLEAMALGMLQLDESEFADLNPSAPMRAANRAVIAPGTGLGEALLYRDGSGFHAVASEGGHSDFAPRTAQQWRLYEWLARYYPQHVSVERIVSGPALPMLYRFLRDTGFAAESAFMAEQELNSDSAALISGRALAGEDALCVETLRLFVEILAAEAGNLALKYLSDGGVYIGGGIAPKILPLLSDGGFMNSFSAKGRFSERLAQMAVRVALNPDTVLLGAAGYCRVS